MLKKILIAFAALVALVLGLGMVLPSTYRVERSTTIQAPSEAVYAFVANLRRWQDWAPWNATKYPGSQWRFGGPEVGAGAVHSWSGEDVGKGTLSLTEADPRTGVAYAMSLEHGRYVMHGRISFAPAESGTRVTWVDEGDLGGNPLMHYLRFLLEARLGGDMEEGLAHLKKQVEASPLPAEAKPEPIPAPLQAPAPEPTPAPAQPAAPQAEGTQAVDAGTPALTVSAPVTSGESTPAPSETPAPTGESAPVELAPAAPAPGSEGGAPTAQE
jgi:hypothetical protein